MGDKMEDIALWAERNFPNGIKGVVHKRHLDALDALDGDDKMVITLPRKIVPPDLASEMARRRTLLLHKSSCIVLEYGIPNRFFVQKEERKDG